MTSLPTYDFSTLYTTLPHNLIKEKLIDLIERTFQREGSTYLASNDINAFFTFEKKLKVFCMVMFFTSIHITCRKYKAKKEETSNAYYVPTQKSTLIRWFKSPMR